jgi:hypothetical protein
MGFDPFGAMKQAQPGLDHVLAGQPSYDVSPEATQKYFNEGVLTPSLSAYDRYIAPRISEAYAGSGASFNSRSGREKADALTQLMTGAQGQLASWQQGNQQLQANLSDSAQTRALSALGMLPGFQNIGMQGLLGLSQLLQPYQQQQNAAAGAKYQDFLRTTPEASPWTGLARSWMDIQTKAVQQQRGVIPMAMDFAGQALGIGAIGKYLMGGGGGGGTQPSAYQPPSSNNLNGNNYGLDAFFTPVDYSYAGYSSTPR